MIIFLGAEPGVESLYKVEIQAELYSLNRALVSKTVGHPPPMKIDDILFIGIGNPR